VHPIARGLDSDGGSLNTQGWLLLLILGYFSLFITVGLVLKKRITRASDFLVAGRALPLWVVAFSIAATQFGGGCIIGGSEWGAQYGMWPGTYSTLSCGLACLIFAYFAGRFRKTAKAITPPDFMEARYGHSPFLRGYHSLVYVAGCTAIIAAQLIGFGYFASVFGFPYWTGVILAASLVGIYTVLAGMWGVAITDFIQFGICLICLPILMLSTISIASVDLGSLLSQPFFPFKGAEREFFYTSVPMILGSLIAYEYFLRWQSAKAAKTAVRGSVIAGVFLILLSVPIGVAGATGAELFPGVEPGEVLPKLIVEVFPLGLAIIFLSTVLVAITSTSAALMTSLGALATRDIYHKLLNKDKDLDSLKHSLAIARISSLGFLMIAALVAIFTKGVLHVLFWPSPLQVGALFVPLIGGMFWKGATRAGAVAGIIGGAGMALIEMTGIFVWPERVLFPLLGSLIIWWLVSLATKKVDLSN